MKKVPFNIRYLPLEISLVSLKRAELPSFLGSTLRGVIGQSLFRIDKEAYEFLYANGKSSERKRDIVNPYVIVTPEICKTERIVERGEEIKFKIILLGNAAKYVTSLSMALQNIYQFGLGVQRYPFCLSQIVNSQEQRVLWRKDINCISKVTEIRVPYHKLTDVTAVEIKLCTPLRIRHNGQLLTSVSFSTLIRNITNRIMAITERYGGWADKEEIKAIQMLAAEVKMLKEDLRLMHLERYSNRLQAKMDLSGLLGKMVFEGDLTPFVPWLFAAQILHIGRNTTFGMGKIEVYFL